jgi:hypothetical protein
LEQVAPESRNLPQQRCALCHCFVDLDQPGQLEIACLLPAPQTTGDFRDHGVGGRTIGAGGKVCAVTATDKAKPTTAINPPFGQPVSAAQALATA